MVKLNHVTKYYQEKCILNDVSEVFSEGDFVILSGKSGAGKTTLLRILMKLEDFEGEVECTGTEMACVFQEDRLMEHMSVLQNLLFTLPETGREKREILHSFRKLSFTNPAVPLPSSSSAVRRRIAAIAEGLSALGMQGEIHNKVSRLSGGMKRRISILRALLHDADLYFFDEAVKGLDEETKKITLDYIQSKMIGKTVFWITHDPSEIRSSAARRCSVGDGKLVCLENSYK